MPTKYIVQHRRGTTAEWAAHNTIIPSNGEIVIEDCSNGRKRIYIGDGITQFKNLHPLSNDDFIWDELDTKADVINGTVISDNADFAEIGEWYDGNPNKENRIGYFVTLKKTVEGFVIDKAISTSDVCGVSVESPAFSGNADNKYDDDGHLLKKYNYVALLGLVSVIDNGTCTFPGKCMPASDGTAIPSTNNMGFDVISRIDARHIEVFVRPGADMLQRIKTDVLDLELLKYEKPSTGIPASDLANNVIPTTLKNPYAIKFTGAVKAQYDGSSEVTVDIPLGGGDVLDWESIRNKPFERLGDTLTVVDGTLDINIHETTNEAGGLTAIIG